MDYWGVALGAGIGSIAWLYQRAWDRQERRILRYQEIIDRLSAFAAGNLDPAKMDEAIREIHRLWLFAPDGVVDACEKVLDIAEGINRDPKQIAVGECILAMRKDSSFSSALIPHFWSTELKPERFKLRSAKRTNALR